MQKLQIGRYTLALALTLAPIASLYAQSTTTTTTTVAPDQNAQTQSQASNEEPIVLSIFTVDTSTDNGYVAVNSLAGGRNNTPLSITPTSVSSLTAAFIDDLQLTNANDALKWTMNAIPGNFAPNVGSGQEFNSWAVDLVLGSNGQDDGYMIYPLSDGNVIAGGYY